MFTRRDKPEWRSRVVLWPRRLTDNTLSSGTLMWRRVGGVDQWRKPTHEEFLSALEARHW